MPRSMLRIPRNFLVPGKVAHTKLAKKQTSTLIIAAKKNCICKDDPEKCDFDCVDAASLLRHRKRFHGYIPGSAPRKKRVKKPRRKRVPTHVIRGIEGDSPGSASAASLSQFNAFSSAEASTSRLSSSRPFSAEASTSESYTSRPFSAESSRPGLSSSRLFFAEASAPGSSLSRPLSPPESESPTTSPSPPNSLSESSSSSSSSSPAAQAFGSQSPQSLLSFSPSPLLYYPQASGSQPRQQSRLRSTYSPAHSSGESEV